MPSEIEYKFIGDYIEGLSKTEKPSLTDKTLVCNETDGPRYVPANPDALTNVATEADMTADAKIRIQTPAGEKQLAANLIGKKSDVNDVVAKNNTLSAKIDEIADVEISPNLVNPDNWLLGTKCILNDSMTIGQADEETNYIFLGTFPIGTELVFRGWITGRSAVAKGDSSGRCVGGYRMPQEDFYETSLDGYSMYLYTTTTEQVGVYVDVRYDGLGTYVAKKADYDRTHKCMAYGEVVSEFKMPVGTSNINDAAVTLDKLEQSIKNKINNVPNELAATASSVTALGARTAALESDVGEIADVEHSPNIVNPDNWLLGTKCILNDSMTVGQADEETNYIFLGTFPVGTQLVFRGWITGRSAVAKGDSSGRCVGGYRMPQEDFYETSLDGYSMYLYTTTTEQVGVYVDVRYDGLGTYVAKKADYDRTHKCMAYGEVVSLFKGTVRTSNIDPHAVTPDKLEADLQSRTGKLLKSREVSLTWVDGYYWAGKRVPHDSFSVSDPILIHGGETLHYYGRFGGTSGSLAVQVDRLGQFIRGLKQGTGGYTEFEYTATVDDEWISFSKSKSNTDSVCVVYRAQDNDVRMAEEQLSKNDYYRFLFQNVDCIGASSTEGYMADQHIRPQYSYPTYLAKITGWNVRNLGVSGATATSWYNGHTGVDYSSTDAVFMLLGINGGLPDTYGEHLGDHTDYYCQILDKILSDNPDCRIFIFTLPGSSSTPLEVTNATLRKIADGYAAQNVAFCDFFDNPYYYMRSQSGGKANYEYHPSDVEGTHYGKIGYLTLARVLFSLAMRWIDTHRSNYELPYVEQQ